MNFNFEELLEAPKPFPKIGLNPKGQDLSGKLRRYRSRGSQINKPEAPKNKEFDQNEIKRIIDLLLPSAEQLSRAARESEKYKETISFLNTLDKDIAVDISISLSDRNVFAALSNITNQSIKDIIAVFFKQFSKKLEFVFLNKQDDLPLFGKITVKMPLDNVPDIINIIPIFYKIGIIFPINLEVSKVPPKPTTIYGICKLNKSYEIIDGMVERKIRSDKFEKDNNNPEPNISSVKNDLEKKMDDFSKLPFQKQVEFLYVPKYELDLTGPFLLKWGETA